MKVIYKYTLTPSNNNLTKPINLPVGYKILTTHSQDMNKIGMWCEVDADPNHPKVEKQFYVFGTGELMPDEGRGQYIGTTFLYVTDLVFHVYEAV